MDRQAAIDLAVITVKNMWRANHKDKGLSWERIIEIGGENVYSFFWWVRHEFKKIMGDR